MNPRLKSFIKQLVPVTILIVIGIIIYGHTVGVPFVFDDWTQIVFNPKIKSLDWPWPFLLDTRRPVLYASLAFNLQISGLQTFGYHVVNISVHIAAAIVLFLLIDKTCRLPKMGESVRKDATLVAFSASLLWLCHPLQTHAVTYIIQRAESLMALLFLLSLYCAVQYFLSRRVAWLAGAGFASLLCGLTKEVALALPMVVLLYDRAFISNSFREALKENVFLYLSLSVMWAAMIILFFVVPPEKIPTAGFQVEGMTPLQYVTNQPRVILHYLRLAIWPDPLVFDYQWPLVKDLLKLLPSIGVIVAGVMGLVLSFRRYPVLGFLGLSFFVILSPSSSVIPLKDLINEYRMYLPLACIAILFVVGLKILIDRWVSPQRRQIYFLIIVGLLVGQLCSLTMERNRVYQSEETLWRDVLAKQPDNVRIWNDLGSYYYKIDRYREAQQCLLTALALNPASAEISANVAMVLMAQKQYDAALVYAHKAVTLSPDFSVGYYNLGILFSRLGRYEEAIANFEKAIQRGFGEPLVLRNLANALAKSGYSQQAAHVLKEAQRLEKH